VGFDFGYTYTSKSLKSYTYTHIPKLIEFATQGLNRKFAFFYLGPFVHAHEWRSTSRDGSVGRGTGTIVALRGQASTDRGADGDSVGELRRWRARSVRKRGELG
jgi:hypothetical protein